MPGLNERWRQVILSSDSLRNLCGGTSLADIDTSGEETLRQVLTTLTQRGVTVAVSRANPSTRDLLAKYLLLKLIGENRLYPSNRHAIAAFREETRQTTLTTTGDLD
jgi:MFS superfamily sulfate permease-like transporter